MNTEKLYEFAQRLENIDKRTEQLKRAIEEDGNKFRVVCTASYGTLAHAEIDEEIGKQALRQELGRLEAERLEVAEQVREL